MLKTLIKKLSRSWLIDLVVGLIAITLIYSVFNFRFIAAEWLAPLVSSFNFSLDWLSDFWNNSYQIVRQTISLNLLAKVGAVALLLLLIIWRLLWRLRTIESLTATVCPKCGYPLSRVKRTNWQRQVSRILPLRRFHCKKCRWTGVRLKPYKPLPLNVQEGTYRTSSQTPKINNK